MDSKLDINGKVVPQIWLVNWNVIPASKNTSIHEHVLSEINSQ